MSIVYYDSSAFVKLLVEEDGTDLAAALWDVSDAVVSSRLAYPEVRAALSATARGDRLRPDDLVRAENAWETYWAAVRPVELTGPVSRRAGTLAREHALRGAGAVHLASVLALGVEETILAAWDRRLRAGASEAGVRLAPA